MDSVCNVIDFSNVHTVSMVHTDWCARYVCLVIQEIVFNLQTTKIKLPT